MTPQGTGHGDIKAIEWEQDSSAIRYAIGDHCAYEPKDWMWWRYDLKVNTKEALPAPGSKVDDSVRTRLRLRLNRSKVECDWPSYLSEAPSGTQFVYAPGDIASTAGNYRIPDFKLWRADINGKNQAFLGDVGEAMAVDWSPREDWILIHTNTYDVPDEHIAKTDGSFFARLADLIKPTLEYPTGLIPRFSPDSEKLVVIGGAPGSTDYATWIIDIDSWNANRVSERAGLIHWSADLRYLYILDQEPYLMSTWQHRDDAFEFNLYRVDLTSAPPREELLAERLPWQRTGSPANDAVWAVSPDGAKIAYAGLNEDGMFGIVSLELSK
jgi:Tol biopolymer transport system component